MLYTRLCSVRGVNAYLKTHQCVTTTIWYSYFTDTTSAQGALALYPFRKGLAFEMLGSDSSAIAGSVNAQSPVCMRLLLKKMT